MELATTLLKKQIRLLRPITNSCPVGITRAAQDKMGELMLRPYDEDVTEKEVDFGDFKSMLITPNDKKATGVVLYLHGGGYVSGGLKYCKGFGTVLAARTGAPVLCVAYRLAPEHPFPAALDDAMRAYNYLLTLGYKPEDVAFCGESAGGGLCFSLAVKLKEMSARMYSCNLTLDRPYAFRRFTYNKRRKRSVADNGTSARTGGYVFRRLHGSTRFSAFCRSFGACAFKDICRLGRNPPR